jgi:preprotein translocase subunit YajC
MYPQQKKMKKHQAMVNALKAGDNIITTAGIVGVVKKVEAGTIVLTVANGVDIEVTKGSVGVVNNESAGQPSCCSN